VTSGDRLSGLLQERQALYENQRDSVTVTIPQVNPSNGGRAALLLYELTRCLFCGSLVIVNAYHQPG